MKSFYHPLALPSLSSGVNANFCRQWGLKSASSTVWSGGCLTTPSVNLKDRERHLKLGLDAQLNRGAKPKRSLGRSRRRSRVRVWIAGGGWISPSLEFSMYQIREQAVLTPEGPSCIFVGPLETAEKKRLEALYQQARDAYYSGRPLIVDDMFDRVETRLRWHGSKLVLKYPRCSLKRFSAYADAELDSSQMLALASVWSVLLAIGVVAAAFPPICAINKACQRVVHLRFESHGENVTAETMMALNGALAIGMGLVIGIPVTLAAARSLHCLWRGDLLALKGFCPNCGEEVYAFVAADHREQPQHKTECHVCEHPLVFRANVERSVSHPGRLFAYGRVYLSTRSKDLAPIKSL